MVILLLSELKDHFILQNFEEYKDYNIRIPINSIEQTNLKI